MSAAQALACVRPKQERRRNLGFVAREEVERIVAGYMVG